MNPRTDDTPRPRWSRSSKVALALLLLLAGLLAASVFLFGERVKHLHPWCEDRVDPETCQVCCDEMAYRHWEVETAGTTTRCVCY